MAIRSSESAAPAKVQVELLHPVSHDGSIFSRGLHELEAALAEIFLKFRDPVSKQAIARLPETKDEPARGSVEPDPAAKKEAKS